MLRWMVSYMILAKCRTCNIMNNYFTDVECRQAVLCVVYCSHFHSHLKDGNSRINFISSHYIYTFSQPFLKVSLSVATDNSFQKIFNKKMVPFLSGDLNLFSSNNRYHLRKWRCFLILTKYLIWTRISLFLKVQHTLIVISAERLCQGQEITFQTTNDGILQVSKRIIAQFDLKDFLALRKLFLQLFRFDSQPRRMAVTLWNGRIRNSFSNMSSLRRSSTLIPPIYVFVSGTQLKQFHLLILCLWHTLVTCISQHFPALPAFRSRQNVLHAWLISAASLQMTFAAFWFCVTSDSYCCCAVVIWLHVIKSLLLIILGFPGITIKFQSQVQEHSTIFSTLSQMQHVKVSSFELFELERGELCSLDFNFLWASCFFLILDILICIYLYQALLVGVFALLSLLMPSKRTLLSCHGEKTFSLLTLIVYFPDERIACPCLVSCSVQYGSEMKTCTS